jgi:hypothetical protein
MIAIAISSVITGSITMTIFQVIVGSARTNNHMIAVRQAQSAGYWVSHDVKMAQSPPIIGDDPGTPAVEEFLTLTWSDWESGEVHQVTYTLEDMAGGSKQLVRNHSVNGTTEATIVAQFIDVTVKDGKAQTRCEPVDGALVFTVTASVGGGSQAESETRVYEILPRPGS